VVDLVGRFALREAVLSFPVTFDIPAGTLDEMPGQLDPLRFCEGGGVSGVELGPEQP
jgi:hypothetical protein